MNRSKWRFYGREDEIEKLVQTYLRSPRFSACRIDGRRGIGKSELMAEAAQRVAGEPPVLIFELLSPEIETAEARNTRLVDEARAIMSEASLDSLDAPVRSDSLPYMRFSGLLARLLDRGVTVAIDEFHLAKPLGLEGPIKMMIDRYQSIQGTPPPAKLFVMGSHQQQVKRMFLPDQPLYQRIYPAFALQQWKAPTVLEMAGEQGFLEHPGRLLTLWTAFGGIPRYWHDFVHREDNARLLDMAAWPDDAEWRRAFVQVQETQLAPGSDDRTDNRSHVELPPPQRDMLQWLAENHPNGTSWDRLADAMRSRGHEDIEEPLGMLIAHLELVQHYAQFWKKGVGRVRIVDNSTLFQRAVFPDLFATRRRVAPAGDGPAGREPTELRIKRLETLEGAALERLAVSYFRAQPGISWSGSRPWRTLPDAASGQVEVDVMALQGQLVDPEACFLMVGCKRNAARHDTRRLDEEVVAFRDDVMRAKDAPAWPGGAEGRMEKLLVSPSFTEEQRARFGAAGFRTLDFADMASPLDLAHDPGTGIEEPEEPDDSTFEPF